MPDSSLLAVSGQIPVCRMVKLLLTVTYGLQREMGHFNIKRPFLNEVNKFKYINFVITKVHGSKKRNSNLNCYNEDIAYTVDIYYFVK